MAIGVVSFASVNENFLYRLFLLLVPAAAVACWKLPKERPGLAVLFLELVGLALLANVIFRPTALAKGYVLAAVGWASLATALWVASSRPLRRAFVLFLIALGALQAAYGLVQAVGGIDQIGQVAREAGDIATGTYLNRNHFAGLLNMVLGLLVGVLFGGFAERRSRTQRASETWGWTWLLLLAASIIGLAIALSLSRAGALIFLAMLLLLFVLLLLQPGGARRHGMPSRVSALLLAVSLAIASGYGIDALIDRFGEIPETGRPQVYRDTLGLIADHPWLGVGPGMYPWRFRSYQTLDASRQYHYAHNDYLHLAAEWGVPVAVAFWIFVLWRLRGALRLYFSRRSAARRGMALGCALAISSILLHSLADFNLHIPANLMIFAIVLGVGWAAEGAERGRGRTGALAGGSG